eukprot:gene43685-54275_t
MLLLGGEAVVALVCPSIERLMAMAKRCALVKIGKGWRKAGLIACASAVWARHGAKLAMKLPTPNLYARLLLWFVAANIATLVVSVFVTERFARNAYRGEPDWTAMAEAANRVYIRKGVQGLDEWRERRQLDGVDASLYEGDRNLLRRPMPPIARRALDRLLSEDAVVLRPRPEVLVVAEKVVGSDSIERRLIAVRGPRAPPPRIEH